jgi:hypothetical protein
MSVDAKVVAARLLDAQVEFVLGELTGKRLAQVVARDVDDVLAIAATLTVADLVDADEVKATGRRLVSKIGGSALVEDLVAAIADALYDLTASEQYRLGEVVARDPVEALVVKVLSMHALHDRALERLTESPLVATVASRFVTKIVGDFLQQNRQLAEKLPGVSSLFSLGSSAASRVKRGTVDQFLGDAAGKSAQFAVRRTNSAMKELIREAPLRGAAMEIWDLHADEPISDLRGYLSQQDLRELALIVHQIVATARDTDYAGALVDECVDVFFERYGERDIASLLPELGISRDDLVDELQTFLPSLIEAARGSGKLDALVRDRLAPFFASKPVLAILAGTAAGPSKPTASKPKPKPAK